MSYILRENTEEECWEILDIKSEQSHDGLVAAVYIALVYDFDRAQVI
ncbi:hypothetical protein LCGC14_0250110, partial [marine sediment metagenome]